MLNFFSVIRIFPTYPRDNMFGNKQSTLLERIAAKVDCYFDIGYQNSVVFVMKQSDTIYYQKVSHKTTSLLSKRPGVCECVLKILSYLLIVPLLIALIFKCILRLLLHCLYYFEPCLPKPSEMLTEVKSGVRKVVQNLKPSTSKKQESAYPKIPGMRRGYSFR
ncbi:DUF648 domain-containing protein [Chlamydia serpentis]|uniref:DUF648 domain-containing protein n=1 Tax=Chlamydia serpentis TaxID=1967782 RepID=UPI0013008222|nr:DUF648 domain-containing protein [Chlamydia serpentis]